MALGGKGGRCVGLTTLPPSRADYFETWEPQSPGTLRVCPGCTPLRYALSCFIYSTDRDMGSLERADV